MSDDLKDGNVIEDTDNPTTAQELDRSSVKDRGLLTEFQVFVEDPNESGGIVPIVLTSAPQVIASLSNLNTPPNFLVIDEITDRVWLNATVGWEAIINVIIVGRVDVLFKIFRDDPITGTLIFSTLDSAEVGADSFATTHLSHVDLNPFGIPPTCPVPPVSPCIKLVNYFLTAELPLLGSAATVIGPITFTGAEIERNLNCCITPP